MSPTRPLTSQARPGNPAGVGPAGPAEAIQADGQPLFAVVKGEPSPEELAALAAVVLSVGSGEPAGPQTPGARQWIRRQQLQLAPRPGPGSWKRSRG